MNKIPENNGIKLASLIINKGALFYGYTVVLGSL